MNSWPYEMRQRSSINKRSLCEALEKSEVEQPGAPDFSRRFVKPAQGHTVAGAAPIESDGALGLDEAAWTHLSKHKAREYNELALSFLKLFEYGVQTSGRSQALQRCVYRLYSDVLRTADCVATARCCV
ncbi:unnamed protein product [Parascedosporium putredinis]|uniref:Uncharacterized protein n=1 Tax=Parascedosporium putredinis TaxID=1442378 RepID=A0A9P1GV06_9PEZI|nr:unnamed protein product [Parascedosporium putredinis]CAI7987887.1 unnamed protein product [Parascedosporium putredinis]